MEEIKHQEAKHPWKARLYVGLAILCLSFIGLVVADLYQDVALSYWKAMVFVTAILSIGLSLYLRRDRKIVSFSAIRKELFHWGGLILALYMVSLFVDMGLLSRFLASLQLMTLLAFAVFLAGVYFEPTFMVIGLILGVFCVTVAYAAEYLYYAVLPLLVLGSALVFWIGKHRARKEDH